MHQIYRDEKINHRKSTTNTENYEKNSNGKKSQRERETFHCENGDNKSGFSVVLGFLA